LRKIKKTNAKIEEIVIMRISWLLFQAYEKTLNLLNDKINYDWNHKTGKFNFIFYYQLNRETFNEEIYHVLDENFMELQRERTYNNLRPGEWNDPADN
jgi:hypothetical protein